MAMAMVMVMGMVTVMVQTVLERGSIVAGWRAHHGPGLASVALMLSGFGVIPAPVQAENWRVRPSIAVNETLTNNVFLSSTNPTSDSVTGISPGISIDGKGARASLRLNYALTQNLYARESQSNNTQNALVAAGMVEAIEDWLFIDATGTISQQYLSALGAVSPSTASVNRNSTETSSYSLSPYIRGRLLNWADYSLRYQVMTTSSQSSLASDLQSSQWLGAVSGSTRWSHITWGLDASNLQSQYGSGRNEESSSYGVRLSYRFNPQFQFSLLGGQESNDYVSLDQQSNFTRGFGLDWTPNPRTRLNGNVRNRFFGTGWDVNFSHRRPRSMLTFRTSKDVSLQSEAVGGTGQGNNYNAFYSIIAASNPGLSPAEIGAQTSQLLVDRGLPADGTVVNTSLQDRPSVVDMQQLTAALMGARNTVTFTATRSVQQGLSVLNGLTNDYSTPGRILQVGYGIIWSHQLSGFSSLSLSFNQQRSGTFVSNSPDTTTSGGYLFLSTRFSPKTSANIGARRVISSGIASYTESALTGAVSHSF
jgi:uncharacterized protein (PEP-CTERM system associated)